MSFLGGVRWADLSSDTHSLSAAPPFCPALDDDAGGPSLSASFLAHARKSRESKGACDAAEALLLQCDAAAEQSYLNPSCAPDLGCSNAGINLQLREAARLNCSTPGDEDMEEVRDCLGTYASRENGGRVSSHVAVEPSAVLSTGGREQRASNSLHQESAGQAASLHCRRGRGFSGKGSSVCTGFKGLLASTNSVRGGSDGVVGARQKLRRTVDPCRSNPAASSDAVSLHHAAACHANRISVRELHQKTVPHKYVGGSGSPSHRGSAGNRHGGARSSTDTSFAVHEEHEKGCAEHNVGKKKYSDVKGGSGRCADTVKGEHPPTSGATSCRAREEQQDLGPDASDNWRSSPTRQRKETPGTQSPKQAASNLCSPTAALTRCIHESPAGHEVDSGGTSGETSNGPPGLASKEAAISGEVAAQERHTHQPRRRASVEEPIQEDCTRVGQRTSVVVPASPFARKSQEDRKQSFRVAARMMTPAKRHRPHAAGGESEAGSMALQSSGECATGEPLPTKPDKDSASRDTETGNEDVGDVPNIRTDEKRGLNVLRAGVAREEDGNELDGHISSSPLQPYSLQGFPPRKKKRGATEPSKRVSAEVGATASTYTPTEEKGTVASAPAATSPISDNDANHSVHQQRHCKKSSSFGAATTGHGRRHSKAWGGNKGAIGKQHLTQEIDSLRYSPATLNQTRECIAGAALAGPGLFPFAAHACPLVQLPGGCFATPPYVMVPVAAATPLTTVRRSSSGSTISSAAVQSATIVCDSAVAAKKPQQREQHKQAILAGTSKRTSFGAASYQDDEETEQEWARRASARMKDIAVGKATEGYRNFIRIVPKDKRRAGDPATPDPKQRCSKAKFQRELLDWRKQLHRYDGCCPPEEYATLPDNSCSSGGAAADWNADILALKCTPPVAGDACRSAERPDAFSSSEGGNLVAQSSYSATAVDSSVPTPLFSTPTGSAEQATTGAAAIVPHPDPIEQFNRECERVWL